MSDFIITADSTVDLPKTYLDENCITVMSLSYILDGTTYEDMDERMSREKFYAMVRGGAMPTTSQINPEQAYDTFKSLSVQGKDILHIGFSSGLSGSYNSARIAAEQLMEEDKSVHIHVIDSLCASMGEGLLLYKVVELRKQGKDIGEVLAWLDENILHVCHNFTVDDLNHLHRGGRVSKATAILGTMVNIKPILHVDDAGHLINIDKTRGRKKSLTALVNRMAEQIRGFEDQNDMVMISHGDCIEDAEYVKKQVEERFGLHNFMINHVGPVIGTHSGPGTIALFFMGNPR
ncbi:DegV family protein [Hespellia stercorisuis]|uniref:EDD domain protein, DegV family n=1 Tax=Hespellia stercorisuis DSM 15480 TaxID=1121950 RepID=A0A1M6STQ8_9FIRM|nr:DegV family protein [Hespellia stercorisuis]SHK48122.1 EDD domain protein, DegV family [Hespellia stercorisuis DSM 15480]